MSRYRAGRQREYWCMKLYQEQSDVLEVFRSSRSRGSADVIVVTTTGTLFIQVKTAYPKRADFAQLEPLASERYERGVRMVQKKGSLERWWQFVPEDDTVYKLPYGWYEINDDGELIEANFR